MNKRQVVLFNVAEVSDGAPPRGRIIMNTIIERLSQIEERSVAAAEGTEKKKADRASMRNGPDSLTGELDQETEERIRKLREQAYAAANARIQSQEKRSGPVHPAAGAPL